MGIDKEISILVDAVHRAWFEFLFCAKIILVYLFSTSNLKYMNESNIRSPCNQAKCHNTSFEDSDMVRCDHVFKYGFILNYYNLIFHGEVFIPFSAQYQFGYFHRECFWGATQQFGFDMSLNYH